MAKKPKPVTNSPPATTGATGASNAAIPHKRSLRTIIRYILIAIPVILVVSIGVGIALQPNRNFALGKFAGFVQSYLIRSKSCNNDLRILAGDLVPDILFAYDASVPINLPDDKVKERKAKLEDKKSKYEYGSSPLYPGFPPILKNWTSVCCDEDFGATDLYIFKMDQVVTVLEAGKNPWKSCEQLQDYMNFFHCEWFPRPTVADHWNDDAEFGRQRLAGVNPVIIRGISTIPSNFEVDKDRINKLLKKGTIDELLTQKRVFLESYEILDDLTVEDDTILAAPLVLHYVDEESKFRPLAIQLFPSASKVTLGTFYSDEKDAWMFAKIVAQNSLAIHHQVITHLLKTHLYSEVFAIATHRTLHPEHPLFVVLQHHFARTLYINHEAVEFLVPTVIKFTASTSVTGSVELGAREWAHANFTDLNLKNNLHRRQVADGRNLPGYDYRDFGVPIWDAIHRYAYGLITSFYPNDEDLAKDHELQNWAKEIATNGKFKEFPSKITTRDQLADILTTIVWTASAQHAAVNFNQYEMLSYVPNMPLAIELNEWPKSKSEIHFKLIEEMLPNCKRSLNQINSVRVLSELPQWPWQYLNWPVTWKNSGAQEARSRFIEELTVLSDTFDGKNQDRPAHLKYHVLYPNKIPLSVGI